MQRDDTQNAQSWNNIYSKFNIHFRQSLISSYHEREQIKILKKWAKKKEKCELVLITDLFNESRGSIDSLSWLINNGYIVIGMDIATKAIFRFKKNEKIRIPCVVCDVKHLSFKDDIFDYVVSFSTLDHCSKDNFEKSLVEIYRVLQGKGKLIITLHNAQNIFLYFYLMKFLREFPFPIECYSIKKTIEIIEKHNFRVKDKEALVHILFPRLFNKLIFLYEKYKMPGVFRTINRLIEIFERIGYLKTKFFTSKLIALCASKEDLVLRI